MLSRKMQMAVPQGGGGGCPWDGVSWELWANTIHSDYTTVDGTASASSEFSSFSAWKALDQNFGTNWYSGLGLGEGGWWNFAVAAPLNCLVGIRLYELKSQEGRMLKDFTVSVDGVVVLTVTGNPLVIGDSYKVFLFDKAVNVGSDIRIDIQAIHGDVNGLAAIPELGFLLAPAA